MFEWHDKKAKSNVRIIACRLKKRQRFSRIHGGKTSRTLAIHSMKCAIFAWECPTGTASSLFRTLSAMDGHGLSAPEKQPIGRKQNTMKHEVIILTDEDYDLNDQLEPEYDVDELRRQAKESGFDTRGRPVWLAADVAAFFPNAEAVNAALRKLISA
jgi:hypothetical protein